MNLWEYREQLGRIPFGKRLPTALYVHRGSLASLGGVLGATVDQVVARYQVSAEFNLVKFRTDELKLSFLAYPEFESDAHPALKHAISIDLATGKVRHTDYAANANPPILHRKETFLPTDHPLRAQFKALTRAEEAAGLYDGPATIGFKLNWERLLQEKSLAVIGHTLTGRGALPPQREASNGEVADVVVERHKTALTRYDLSKPVKSLLEYGLLRSETTFFDYGCGQFWKLALGLGRIRINALSYSWRGQSLTRSGFEEREQWLLKCSLASAHSSALITLSPLFPIPAAAPHTSGTAPP